MIDLKDALLDQEVAPTVLAHLFMDGPMEKVWLEWDPVVLWEELEKIAGTKLTRTQQDKIMATRVAIKTDQPLTQYPVFMNTCFAFNGIDINPETALIPTPQMIAWTLLELRDIGGDPLEEDPEVELNYSVSAFVCACLFEHGLAWVPEYPMGRMIQGDLIKYATDYNPESLRFALDAEAEYKHVVATGSTDSEPESPLAVHTVKLLAIDAYVAERLAAKKGALSNV